jgi:hypothetical protein
VAPFLECLVCVFLANFLLHCCGRVLTLCFVFGGGNEKGSLRDQGECKEELARRV